MKTTLFDFETHVSQDLLEEAMTLVKDTHEFDLTRAESGRYHILSRQPDYHVEIQLREDGTAIAKCHCRVFKKTKQCRHALAALYLLRDATLRRRKGTSTTDPDPLSEVVRKLKINELRALITGYGRSHSAFRAEVLARHLHLLRKPDYHRLLQDITPIDKYGQIGVNRNNLKSIRNIIVILLHQVQQDLLDKAPASALQILSAVLRHLHRLIHRLPQFRDQLSTELRQASRHFEAMCRLPMAPRLQSEATQLALEISEREDYTVLPNTPILLACVEPFLTERKAQQAAIKIAAKKATTDQQGQLQWCVLLIRWERLWSIKVQDRETNQILDRRLPEVMLEYGRMGQSEDVLYALTRLHRHSFTPPIIKAALKSGLKAAFHTGDLPKVEALAFELSLDHLDIEAWDKLYTESPEVALRALRTLEDLYAPGSELAADELLCFGYSASLQRDRLLERLAGSHNNEELLMQYDHHLSGTYESTLAGVYATYISSIRDAYGGVAARQKLSSIFGHLKSNGLHTTVQEKLKQMEQKNNTAIPPQGFRGFVFDLDGVIVDTAIHHFQSWKQIFFEHGTVISDEDDIHTRGASRMESLEYLLQKYRVTLSAADKEQWASRKNDLYLEAIDQLTPADLLPGVLNFLQESRKAGLQLALGSASKNARGVLKKLEIASLFDAILDGHDAKESKPHPEIFIKACQALRLEPDTVVVFEDAAKGVQAAVSAGCKVVGLGDPAILYQADIVIPGLHEESPQSIMEQLA